MLDVRDKRLYRFLSNYRLNLISPADMDENEFEKFHTELGFAMKLLKHQSEDADELIIREGHRKISSETAYFLNAAMKLNLEIEVEPGGVDMCKAMEKREQKQRIEEAIEIYREYGESDEAIINKIMNKFKVTREFVIAQLTLQRI